MLSGWRGRRRRKRSHDRDEGNFVMRVMSLCAMCGGIVGESGMEGAMGTHAGFKGSGRHPHMVILRSDLSTDAEHYTVILLHHNIKLWFL
jgi:hypothetical protein